MNVQHQFGKFEILTPKRRFPNTRLSIPPISPVNTISHLQEDFLYPRSRHEGSRLSILGTTQLPMISCTKIDRTANRVDNEKEFSTSAPNSAFVSLVRSLFWQHFSANRNNAVGICSSGPRVSSNTLNNLELASSGDKRTKDDDVWG
jgi:hypothetical protein